MNVKEVKKKRRNRHKQIIKTHYNIHAKLRKQVRKNTEKYYSEDSENIRIVNEVKKKRIYIDINKEVKTE